ncbi:MAG: hypothetical protein ACP5IV_07855 [Caldisericia bacterium]
MYLLNFLRYLKLKLKSKRGATVLETILLLIVALVIIFVIWNFFAAGDNSIISQLVNKVKELLGIVSPQKPPTP